EDNVSGAAQLSFKNLDAFITAEDGGSGSDVEMDVRKNHGGSTSKGNLHVVTQDGRDRREKQTEQEAFVDFMLHGPDHAISRNAAQHPRVAAWLAEEFRQNYGGAGAGDEGGGDGAGGDEKDLFEDEEDVDMEDEDPLDFSGLEAVDLEDLDSDEDEEETSHFAQEAAEPPPPPPPVFDPYLPPSDSEAEHVYSDGNLDPRVTPTPVRSAFPDRISTYTSPQDTRQEWAKKLVGHPRGRRLQKQFLRSDVEESVMMPVADYRRHQWMCDKMTKFGQGVDPIICREAFQCLLPYSFLLYCPRDYGNNGQPSWRHYVRQEEGPKTNFALATADTAETLAYNIQLKGLDYAHCESAIDKWEDQTSGYVSPREKAVWLENRVWSWGLLYRGVGFTEYQ
ncbi:unnamed protein product, partial [Amoebophrya sp. A120]